MINNKKLQQVLIFSKSGKTLVRRERKDEGLLSFDDRDALCKFLAQFKFECFIEEEHIINLKVNDLVFLEYHAFLVAEEDDLNNDNYIWCDKTKTELFSDEEFSFSIDVQMFIKNKEHYIKCKDKHTVQDKKNFTADELYRYVSEHGERIKMKTNFPKNYVLIIINEEGKILRPYRRQNQFATQRMLECCLKSYGFQVLNRVDINSDADEKHYCLVNAKTNLRTDCTYYWDEPYEEEDKFIREYKLI